MPRSSRPLPAIPALRRASRAGLAALALGAASAAWAADHRDAPILVGGRPLESPQEARSLVVTQELGQPAFADVEIFGGGRRGASPPGVVGETLEVRVGQGADAATLFQGEIVSIEPAFGRDAPAARVRGYDLSHRLTRARRTRTWPDTSDGALVAEIARLHGLPAEISDPGFRSAYVLQRDQTDLEFLRERAARIGYALSMEDGALRFAPLPAEPAAALHFGAGLRSFVGTPDVPAVQRVEVRGWNPVEKKPLVGLAETAGASPEATLFLDRGDPLSESPSLAEGQLFSPEEAALVAAAELAAAADAGGGVAAGDPRIRAGHVVELAGLGDRFSGLYLVTKATHTIAPDGYTTEFEARRIGR